MSDMDLVPGEFRRSLALRGNLRRFFWGAVLLVVLVATARAALGYLTWRERTQVVSLEQQQLAFSQTENQTESLRQQRLVTQQQLATLDKLQGSELVERFLWSIDDAYVEHIWLDAIQFKRRENTGAPTGASPEATQAAPQGTANANDLNVLHDAQITGHAATHSDLATFMQSLGAQPAVADLRLINTATRSYTSVQVIDFRLALQVRGGAHP
jgi:cell division protein FtsB/predicted nuclease of predicted toxin-antitoxin system